MTIQEYRDHPALNFSAAKHLLRSPAHYQAYRNAKAKPTAEMQFGTTVHERVLEGKTSSYVIRPNENEAGDKWHGAKKWCKEWMAAQTQPVVTEEDVADIEGCVASLKDSADFRQVLKLCPQRETPLIVEYAGVQIKALFDMLGQDAAGNHFIADLKTCQDASPEGFLRSVIKFRYHMQAAWYQAVLATHLRLEEPPKWLWIAVENTAPYNVAIYALPDAAAEEGQRQMERALRIYRECVNENTWTGYPSGIQTLEWPKWANSENDA